MNVSSPSKRRRFNEEIVDGDDSDKENSLVVDDEKYLKDELLKVLTNIHEKKRFEFVVSDISTDLSPSPAIKIPGYGPVSLPVTDTTIGELKKHFHQAPYGLGEATLIDKTVRDSWQLDPKDFVITNSNFNAGIKKLVQVIQNDLGICEQKVTSHLYKLLLYERGGHFKPHRDTEKHKGMFATLIIQLPSIFTGGDLVVKHGSREKRIVFGNPQSEFSCMYAAHYADCEHELTEITSGYRMALVYSLCWDSIGLIPTPFDVPITKLEGLLKKIDEVLPHPSIIAWGLDHHYSESSFLNKGIQALKGGDKHIYSSLQSVNDMLEEDKKLDFFLVEAKKLDNMYGSCKLEWSRRMHGSGCRKCFEEEGSDTEFEFNVIGTDGKPWKGRSHFSLDVEEDVLNVGEDDDEFWGKCNEGECSGPSGNEGSSKTDWYQRYVLLIIPRKNALKLVYKSGVNSAIDYLAQQLKREETPSLRKLTCDIVDLCVKEKKTFCEDESSVVTVLTLLLKLKELDLTKKILPLLSEPLVYDWNLPGLYWRSDRPRVAFGIPSEKTICLLEDLIKAFGWQPLEESLLTLIHSCPSKQCGNVITLLENCPAAMNKDSLIADKIKKAVNSSEETLTEECIIAICLYICDHLETCSQFTQPLLDKPKLQNLQMLIKVLSLVKEKLEQNAKGNKLYQMTLAKSFGQLQKLFQAGKVKSPFEIDAVVKAADFFVSMQENNLIEKLVEEVLLMTDNENLLKKLLGGDLGHSKIISESIKCLIQTRISQLLPIVQADKPVVNWCQPHAVLPNHPEVQAFLRGPNKSFVYDKFTAKSQAMAFKKEYFSGGGNGIIEVIGSRKNTKVEITKFMPNSMKQEEALRKYEEAYEEMKKLQAKINGK